VSSCSLNSLDNELLGVISEVRRPGRLAKTGAYAERNFLTSAKLFKALATDAKGVISDFQRRRRNMLGLHRCRSGKQHQHRPIFPIPQGNLIARARSIEWLNLPH